MSKELKACESLVFTREDIQRAIRGVTLTDELWERLVDEIDGRTSNFLDEILGQYIEEIENGEWD